MMRKDFAPVSNRVTPFIQARSHIVPAAAGRPSTRDGIPSLDIETLLQGSANSRQEVKRRVEEKVGSALTNASRCVVNIQLVDESGHPVREVPPVEVELKRGERLRQLALTLIVNLQGE